MTVKIDTRVAWREVDGQVFVIDLRARKLYGLSPAGGRIWRELAQGADLESVASTLGPDGSQEGADLATFIAELENAGLVGEGDGLATAQASASGLPARTNVPPPRAGAAPHRLGGAAQLVRRLLRLPRRPEPGLQRGADAVAPPYPQPTSHALRVATRPPSRRRERGAAPERERRLRPA